jgi:hypothetical protein
MYTMGPYHVSGNVLPLKRKSQSLFLSKKYGKNVEKMEKMWKKYISRIE